MDIKKQIALYTFQSLINACSNSQYNNCDERDWEQHFTHDNYEFYCQYEYEVRQMTSELIRNSFVDKVQRKGKYGTFTMLKPSKLGLERFKKYN